VGLAVVTGAAGLAVTDVTAGSARGMPVSESAAKYGIAVTKVASGGIPVVYETIGILPPVPPLSSFATFDGTPSASVALSNGNLTVTHGSTANATGVFSTKALSTGKYYFEVLLQTSMSNTNGAGIKVYAGGAFSDATGQFPTGIGVSTGTATSLIYANGVSTGKNFGAFAVGNRICAAIDLTNRLAWFRKDGGLWNVDAAADPATGVNGLAFPTGAQAPCVRFTNGAATDAFTANFGASAFAFTPPAGFSLGWGT
jgi:hypothetical protein